MKSMFLHMSTDCANSECSTDMGITKSNWEALSEEDKADMINELIGNIGEIWTQEGEREV